MSFDSLHLHTSVTKGSWQMNEDEIQAGTPLSKLPHHFNMRTLTLDRFNVHQPLYTASLQLHQDLCHRLDNAGHDFAIMTNRLPRIFFLKSNT
ncbi:hypothetical protein TNCV_3076611 [Trichonephila clavipes]|nr:hypothetical protein TNCV_3076611 [Trichonephila clavipes]